MLIVIVIPSATADDDVYIGGIFSIGGIPVGENNIINVHNIDADEWFEFVTDSFGAYSGNIGEGLISGDLIEITPEPLSSGILTYKSQFHVSPDEIATGSIKYDINLAPENDDDVFKMGPSTHSNYAWGGDNNNPEYKSIGYLNGDRTFDLGFGAAGHLESVSTVGTWPNTFDLISNHNYLGEEFIDISLFQAEPIWTGLPPVETEGWSEIGFYDTIASNDWNEASFKIGTTRHWDPTFTWTVDLTDENIDFENTWVFAADGYYHFKATLWWEAAVADEDYPNQPLWEGLETYTFHFGFKPTN